MLPSVLVFQPNMPDAGTNQGLIATALCETCLVPMLNNKPCGRPSFGPPVEGASYCLMHTALGKDDAAFQEEFDRILDEAGTGDADFTRFVFANANYEGREFKAHCAFVDAKFTHNANFGRAAFRQNADFMEATFTQEADFTDATFKRDANFTDAIFMQKVKFRRATFTRYAHFRWTTLTGEVSFEEAKFFGGAGFRETKFRQDKELFSGPVFSLAEFSRPEAIVFYKTYLGQALLYNCDVSKLVFSSVEWRRRKNGQKRTGRWMVFEEEVLLDDKNAKALRLGSGEECDFDLVADLYHQLKKNYDERKDYWTAGDFHYGEMEMHRLRTWSPRFALVAWNKYASCYGENYARPFLALLFVLAIFTVLFPVAGLNQNESRSHAAAGVPAQQNPPSTISELSYRHLADFVAAYPGGKWVGYSAFWGNSLMTTLSVAGFQKEFKYEPSYPWGRVLALLELLLTSTLIALFLLAVRRQFRR